MEKSIAVLPFKNDSNDSTNVYLINGLMESTLNNLQKIKDLKVISRTSTEKYRNTPRSIPEMSEELNVNYFVEGSGQKIGDQILLNIQLIEGKTDRHLWARQYKREAKDIFALQQEIAKSIAEEIQVIITPEEQKRIEKIPTDDLAAYDLFLKGLDFMSKGGDKNLETAILHFDEATKKDPEFALAYAQAVMAYYYLDVFKAEKKYMTEIGSLSDKALLHDPRLPESLVAKAIFYLQRKEYDLALPYLEKSFEYNPNSAVTLAFLTDYYTNYSPNTSKYLEYAMKGLRVGVNTQDSTTASYAYLRLSNALMQAGFFKEALQNIDKSLAYFPENPYAYIKVYMHLAIDKDCPKAKERLLTYLEKDSTRIDIIQEIGKVCTLMGDYEEAYKYYKRFIDLRETYKLDIYKHESLRIAFVLSKVGQKEKAEQFAQTFKQFADNNHTIYKQALLSSYYGYRGDIEKAVEHLRLFSKEDDFLYWVLIFEDDPMTANLKNLPEVKKIMSGLEKKFWDRHEKVKDRLQEEGLI
jgi:TolB-like protein/Tfp pilus assembly protein PilF